MNAEPPNPNFTAPTPDNQAARLAELPTGSEISTAATTVQLWQYPIRVLSDLHLAHPATWIHAVEQLTPLLDGCQTVFFNGDSAEILSLERRQQAREQLSALVELCARLGCTPYFLTGNHDPHISNFHAVQLHQDLLLITHGDALHPAVAPWSREGKFMGHEFQRLLHERGLDQTRNLHECQALCKQAAMVAAVHDKEVAAGQSADRDMLMRFVYHPLRIWRALDYWARVPHYARHFRDRFCPKARLGIMGHSHRPGIWRRPDWIWINTGSFQPFSYPQVVQIEPEHLTVWRVRQRAGQFQLQLRAEGSLLPDGTWNPSQPGSVATSSAAY